MPSWKWSGLNKWQFAVTLWWEMRYNIYNSCSKSCYSVLYFTATCAHPLLVLICAHFNKCGKYNILKDDTDPLHQLIFLIRTWNTSIQVWFLLYRLINNHAKGIALVNIMLNTERRAGWALVWVNVKRPQGLFHRARHTDQPTATKARYPAFTSQPDLTHGFG